MNRQLPRLVHVFGLLDALATLVAIIAGLTGNLPAGISQALNDLTTAASIILALLGIGGVLLLVPIIRSQLDPPFDTEQWFARQGRPADLNRSPQSPAPAPPKQGAHDAPSTHPRWRLST